MSRCKITVCCLFLCYVTAAFAQTSSDFTISVFGTADFPLGPKLDDGLVYYDIGAGGGVYGELAPSSISFSFIRAGLSIDQLPVKKGTASLTLVSLGGALGVSWSPFNLLALRAFAGGGLYLGIVEAGMVRNPYWEAGVDLKWTLTSTVGLGLSCRYRDYRVPSGSVFNGISISSGVTFDLAGARKGSSIRMESRLLPIFPLFYTYYENNPAGYIVIQNDERVSLDDMKVSIYVRQYMDGPRTFAELPKLASKASVELPVYALFNDQIFRVTEGTKSAGEIIVEYYYLGAPRKVTFPVTVAINNRNAMTWDDDRKAAAFVAAKNPSVLGFAKGFAANARTEGNGVISTDFRIAVALLEALRLHGLGYVVDPSTPYASLASSDSAVDFIQFPQQTLAYKAGDCDDLSILYAAVLEASGIRSAFALVPGHIFVAFDSGLTPEMASRIFSGPEDYVLRDGTVWIPVEVTLVKDGFDKAWRYGVREWLDAERDGTLSVFETRKAWELYEPVGIASDGIAFYLPEPAAAAKSYKSEMDAIIADLLKDRVAELSAKIASGTNVGPNLNKLGVLYARFGFMDKAKKYFTDAVNRGQYADAMVNLGNIEYLENRPADAALWYEKALNDAPDSANALVGLARSRKALGETESYEAAVARLKTVSPEMAAEFGLSAEKPAAAERQRDRTAGEAKLWTE